MTVMGASTAGLDRNKRDKQRCTLLYRQSDQKPPVSPVFHLSPLLKNYFRKTWREKSSNWHNQSAELLNQVMGSAAKGLSSLQDPGLWYHVDL